MSEEAKNSLNPKLQHLIENPSKMLVQLFEHKEFLITQFKEEKKQEKKSYSQLIDSCAELMWKSQVQLAQIRINEKTILLDEDCRKKQADLLIQLHNANHIVEQQQFVLNNLTGKSYILELAKVDYFEKYVDLSSETAKNQLAALEISKQDINAAVVHTALKAKSELAKDSRKKTA